MTLEPIMHRKFSFKKSALNHLNVLGGLDQGCSMTKIIYVDKKDADRLDPESNSEYIILTIALFSNSEFENALLYLKDNAYFTANKSFPFHTTGIGGVKFNEQIKKALDRDVIYIDEGLTQCRGAHFLLSNIPLEEITFKEVETDFCESFNIEFTKKIKYQFEKIVGKKKKIKSPSDCFPCIFGFLGSGGVICYIETDGTYRLISIAPGCGKTFMGLCRCILGTNDYKEITNMASQGDRRNIDGDIKSILNQNIPVNDISKELPLIHFGKLSNTKRSINEFNKNDIAHSLVSIFMYNTLISAIQACMIEKVSNIFFGGHLFQSEIFRKECSTLKNLFGFDFINVYFLNNGHTGALGAMLSSPEDFEQYFKNTCCLKLVANPLYCG